MSDSYEINQENLVVPYTCGRMCNDTRTWRDATELELSQREEIEDLTEQLQKTEEERDELKSQVNNYKNFLSDLQISNEVVFVDKSDSSGTAVLHFYSRADLYPICYDILEAWERFEKEAWR